MLSEVKNENSIEMPQTEQPHIFQQAYGVHLGSDEEEEKED